VFATVGHYQLDRVLMWRIEVDADETRC